MFLQVLLYVSIRGYEEWRLNPTSRIYDQVQIQRRTNILAALKDTKNFANVGFNLRSGLIRNFCGIGDPRLFSKFYLGYATLGLVHRLEQRSPLRSILIKYPLYWNTLQIPILMEALASKRNLSCSATVGKVLDKRHSCFKAGPLLDSCTSVLQNVCLNKA